MEGRKKKAIIILPKFYVSLNQILNYGEKTFGTRKAVEYENLIYESIHRLSTGYLLHAEYQYLPTKNKLYRRIVLPAHFIIYRVHKNYVEVLDIIHQSRSITKIRQVRKIKP